MKNESVGTIFLSGEARQKAIYADFVKYECERCGGSVLMVKGKGLGDTMRCAAPCYGTMRRLRAPQFWEVER